MHCYRYWEKLGVFYYEVFMIYDSIQDHFKGQGYKPDQLHDHSQSQLCENLTKLGFIADNLKLREIVIWLRFAVTIFKARLLYFFLSR